MTDSIPRLGAIFVTPLLFLTLTATPAEEAAPESAPAAAARPEALHERISETEHTVRIGGQTVRYRASAGTMLLKDEDATPRASFFFVAYTRLGEAEPATRPITFAFNGGPGSSSVWLHLGAFGPRRVQMTEEGMALAPPGRLVDNEHSLLDLTDLVFIDPVTTGFSRAVPDQDDAQFHGVREDIESVGEFIRLYCSRYGRWASPKFLAGESYGTTRAAGLAGWLQTRHGMYLNGIILVSAVLNFQTLDFHPGNDLPYLLFLPTYATTARFHGRLAEGVAPDLEAFTAEVEAFALGDYAAALLAGERLDAESRRRIVGKLVRYTGLPEALIEEHNLRIGEWPFMEELLRADGLQVGRLDSRFTRPLTRAEGLERFGTDPSYHAILGPYTASLNDYVREELGFESDLPYEILTDRVYPWSFGEFQNRYVDVATTLHDAMIRNPYLKVFVANGYYDLATAYFATEYTFDHLDLTDKLRSNVSMGYYEAGHMMYIREVELAKLKRDLAGFLGSAVSD